MNGSGASSLSNTFSIPKLRFGHHMPMLGLILGLILVTSLMVTRLGIAAFEIFVRDADKSSDETPVVTMLGDTPLEIPRNMIRFASQRSGGARSRLGLHLHWPSMEGFTAERAGAFQAAVGEAPIIYVTLTPADDTMSPERRFRNVYPRLLADGMRQTEGGYIVRSFQDGFGYDDEELFIARHPERPLAARCETAESTTGAVCISEFRTEDNIDVAYRFRRTLMEDWRTIDEEITELVGGFVTSASD